MFYTQLKPSHASFIKIPKFYSKLPGEHEVLKLKLREEARAVFLQRKSRELIDNDELQKLWFLLDEFKVGDPVNDEGMINFSSFKKV